MSKINPDTKYVCVLETKPRTYSMQQARFELRERRLGGVNPDLS